jgi:endonuclease-8
VTCAGGSVPEGDTVYLEARNLDAALAGETLTRCDMRVPAFATVDLTGEQVDSVVSRGKHLLMRVGEYSIHSHLKMEGSWHLYRPGTPWRRPAWEARAILGTAGWTAVGFALGTLEVLPRAQEHEAVGHLGPDLLGDDWDAEEASNRLRQHPEVPVFVAVLDQRNLAGIGNVYANELLFLRGLAPALPVGEVSDVDGLVGLAHRLLDANKNRSVRSTTGNVRSGQTSWVYGRAGKPCRRCGTRIAMAKLGASQQTERDVYWCPSCQPG